MKTPYIVDVRVGCVAVYRGPKIDCLEGGRFAFYRSLPREGEEVLFSDLETRENAIKKAHAVCDALNEQDRLDRPNINVPEPPPIPTAEQPLWEQVIADMQARDQFIQALDAQIVPVTKIPDVLQEWREPRHSEFCEGKTAWRLFNAFTEILKGNLDLLPRRTQALHGLMDGACGLVIEQKPELVLSV